MVRLIRSQLEAKWVEIWEDDRLIQEIEVLFPIRKFPVFSNVQEAVAWIQETEYKQAKAYAYRLLAMKSFASTILKQKLEMKGYRSVERIIEELKKAGYLQDDEYWNGLILREFQKGYGPLYLEWKKKAPAKQVRALISEAMQRKKIRELKEKYPRKNMARFLTQRGFDLDCIRKEIEIFS